jgi:hypothetical protein
MAKTQTKKRQFIDRTLNAFGAVAVIVLLAVGGLSWWAYSFTASNVHNELVAQKIYFPVKGSPALAALPAADRAAIGRYAGQQVLNGAQAKVFANNYIAVHLKEIAGGKTYSEVSAESLADPSNAQLKGKAQTLFQGETLRGLLLGDAYAFWMVGHIAQIVALVAFAGAGVMSVLVLLGLRHLAKIS